MGFILRRTAGTAHKYRDRDREALASICGLELQLRDSIHGGERLFARPFSFRTGGMQDATMFSAKTIIFRAIIPLLCRKHLPADFGKPLLHVFAHFSPLLVLHREHAVNPGHLMFTSWLRWASARPPPRLSDHSVQQ